MPKLNWPRFVLLLPLLWWTFRLGSGSTTWCFIDFVNLAFHESGHLLFSPFGKTIHYLGGAFGQLMVPGLLTWYFLVRRREPFSSAICAWWFGENFINIAIYMADARSLALPLVGGGDHDWNELFYRFGTLTQPAVERIASITHGAGVVFMLLGLAWAVFFALPEKKQATLRNRWTIRYPWLELFL